MHRQSLGSPGSRSGGGSGGAGSGGAADLGKPEKPIRSPAAAAASRSSRAVVHAIPIATLLCFLVLYLLSHDPAIDLAAGNGGAESAVLTKKAVSGVNIGRYIGGGGVSAARGLMEERRMRHRKDLAAAHVRTSRL